MNIEEAAEQARQMLKESERAEYLDTEEALQLLNRIAEARGPRVLITIEGGLISAIAADQPVEIAVIDFDLKEGGDADEDILYDYPLDGTSPEEYECAALEAWKSQAEWEEERRGED